MTTNTVVGTTQISSTPEWRDRNLMSDYVSTLKDTRITVHYGQREGTSYKAVEWIEIVQHDPVPNPLWDETFRLPRAPDALETKPKRRKFRYDGDIETVETIYSTKRVSITRIGSPTPHSIEEYEETSESKGIISGNVVGFWPEVRKYSSHIEALIKEKQLKSPILDKFGRLDEPITEENKERTLKDVEVIDWNGRKFYLDTRYQP